MFYTYGLACFVRESLKHAGFPLSFEKRRVKQSSGEAGLK